MSEKDIRIRTELMITDLSEFLGLLEAKNLDEVGPDHLARLARPADSVEAMGLSSLTHGEIDLQDDRLVFESSAIVADMEVFSASAQAQYEACWNDPDWRPGSPAEALFEILIASNANDSPASHGFYIVDYQDIGSGPEPDEPDTP